MTWLAGQQITAEALGRRTRYAHKPSQTSRTQTVTPTPDPHLTLELEAGLWEIEAGLYYGSATGPNGIRVTWEVPAGTETVCLRLCMGPSPTSTSGSDTSIRAIGLSPTQAATYGSRSGIDSPAYATEAALLRITTPGTVAIAWAQQTTSDLATRLHAGSWLRAEYIEEEAP